MSLPNYGLQPTRDEVEETPLAILKHPFMRERISLRKTQIMTKEDEYVVLSGNHINNSWTEKTP